MGIDTIQGEDGDDRIIYDSQDLSIDGGAGIDTLVIDGSLPVGFDLTLNNFEFAEQLIHNATNEQVNQFNENWQLVSRQFTYLDGDQTTIVWDLENVETWARQITYSDISDSQNWTTYSDSYNDLNQITERKFTNDDGNTVTTTWDVEEVMPWSKTIEYGDETNTKSWTTYKDTYNDLNQITERIYELDNTDTNLIVWDVENNESWARSIQFTDGIGSRGWADYINYYNDSGQIYKRTYNLDNSDVTHTTWDVENNEPWDKIVQFTDGIGSRGWADYINYYNDSGQIYKRTYNLDNSDVTHTTWDVENNESWTYQQTFVDGLQTRSYSEYTKSYNDTHQLMQYEILLDSGDSTLEIFDFDDTQSWSKQLTYTDGIGTRNWASYTDTYDDQNRLSEKLFIFDNGNQTEQTWDLDDNESWYRQDRQLDTADLYTWSERIFEYDEAGNLLNSSVIDDGVS